MPESAEANRPSSRERIAALRATDPSITMAELARRLLISKTRVRQLLLSMGLPTVPRSRE